jgi:regulator of sigma E protease
MHELLVTVVAFIVLIGLMVVVHEFGHFAVAKLCRVRVEAFSFGFGPRLFGYKYGETDYKVCLLPLGGYVKMTGENPGEGEPVNDPGAFSSHPRWQRILIGVAGPAANFVLAFVLMFVYFAWLNEIPSAHPPQLEWVTPGSVADQAGLKPGDAIVSFGNVTAPDLGVLLDELSDNNGQTVPVTVLRGGQPVRLALPVPGGKNDDIGRVGFYPHFADKPLTIAGIIPNSAAAEVGLHTGDQILSVDGYGFHTVDPLLDYLQHGKGKQITLLVRRSSGAQETLVAHPHQQDGVWLVGIKPDSYGSIAVRRAPMTVAKAASRSYEFCAVGSKMIGQMVGKLVTRQASIKQLSGPVGIAVVAGKAAETRDWGDKFNLAAAISLNLGILNLLPFPILDGGLILLLLIESVLRHDISMAVKERIYQAAFVLIVVFFAFVIFNDVSNLPFFSRLHQ